MSYDIQITDTKTGETRSYTDPYLDEHGHADDYWPFYIWSDGNFSCDCNRFLFFERAGGKEPHDPGYEGEDGGCGDKRYTVRILLDGEAVYEDDADDDPAPLQ